MKMDDGAHVKKRSMNEPRRDGLEDDFRPLPLACLRECADGRYGLSGQNDAPEIARYYQWDEADSLQEIALEICALRIEFGQPNTLAERFLHCCSLRGSNVPGEPKLAKAFLNEISRGDFKPFSHADLS
jgi:hypothetical protein